jgi:hypothetical protein
MIKIYLEIDRIITGSSETNPWVLYEKVKKYLRTLVISNEAYEKAIKYTDNKLNRSVSA